MHIFQYQYFDTIVVKNETAYPKSQKTNAEKNQTQTNTLYPYFLQEKNKMKFTFVTRFVPQTGTKDSKDMEIDTGDTIINKKYYQNTDISLKNHSSGKNIYANRYNDTSKRFKGFFELLFKWNGSVFKLIWHNLLIFMMVYTILAVFYRTIRESNQVVKEYFELLCIYCSR